MNKHCVHQSHTKQYFCKSRSSASRLNIKHVEALTTQSGSSFHTPIILFGKLYWNASTAAHCFCISCIPSAWIHWELHKIMQQPLPKFKGFHKMFFSNMVFYNCGLPVSHRKLFVLPCVLPFVLTV